MLGLKESMARDIGTDMSLRNVSAALRCGEHQIVKISYISMSKTNS